MSTILTRSKFYYGAEITKLTNALDFDEGGSELNATLTVGDYTMQDLANEMARAMNEVGALTYTGSFNRTTREITIAAVSAFTLRTFTGSRAALSAYEMLGFDVSADYASAVTHTGEMQAAFEYLAQYPFDKYVSADHSRVKEQATANVSATGVTQLISFAEGARVELNMKLITDKVLNDCQANFFNNVNGVSSFLNFMDSIMKKGKLELMPDVDTPATFVKLTLESTKEDRAGLRFELKNMKTPDIYESGTLVFRKVIET